MSVQKRGFVGFHDALQMRWFDVSREVKKSVAPAEGRVLVNAAAARGVARRVAINEGLGVLAPALAVSQMGQWGVGEGIEGLAAGRAAKPR